MWLWSQINIWCSIPGKYWLNCFVNHTQMRTEYSLWLKKIMYLLNVALTEGVGPPGTVLWAVVCQAGWWWQGLFCWHSDGPVSGMFSAWCLGLESSAQGWGLVVGWRHHTVPLNSSQPPKFLFLGRKLKYCAVLACRWSSITSITFLRQSWTAEPGFKGKVERPGRGKRIVRLAGVQAWEMEMISKRIITGNIH